ncbi:MAG: imelysin family protein [Flavobacteriales bacterium]|jgi:predicted lipoprotein
MKKNRFLLSIIALLTLGILFVSCDKEKENEDDDTFDRTELLRNYADNIIKPAFEDLYDATDEMNSAIINFAMYPYQQRLDEAREAWRQAYNQFMYCNSFNFGPAGESGIRKSLVEEIATWPANVALINQNIADGNYTFNDFNRDNRGFHAIEYLLFNGTSDEEIINSVLNNPSFKNYLMMLAVKVSGEVYLVLEDWNGQYYNEFISKNGTDVGSSCSMMYNEFVKSFEAIKNFKLGIPLGLRAGQTAPSPSSVEAFYSKESLRFLTTHLQTIEALWYGRNKDGVDGIGWKEYIESSEGGAALVASTQAQFDVIRAKLNDIPQNTALDEQINTNFAALEALHTELQRHTRFVKSDMSSILGITITFSSGDGD